jgi:hypothetical protein
VGVEVGEAIGVELGVGDADGEIATVTAFPFFQTRRPFCRTHLYAKPPETIF